eukprot:2806940-Alexandrium_andersonii.AAC.1
MAGNPSCSANGLATHSLLAPHPPRGPRSARHLIVLPAARPARPARPLSRLPDRQALSLIHI